MSNNFKAISTKVTPEALKMLTNISSKKGITIYDMLQMMCDCIVRYMSDEHSRTPDIEKIMRIFEHMEGWKNCFTLVEPGLNPEISEATYFVGDTSKSGVRAVHVRRQSLGDWEQTENVQDILERNICLLFPERYRKMRQVALDMNCLSILDMFDQLIDNYIKDQDEECIRELFSDCNRSDYGTRPTDFRYKRKMHKDIDAPDLQQTISFDELDKQMADEEAEDGTF